MIMVKWYKMLETICQYRMEQKLGVYFKILFGFLSHLILTLIFLEPVVPSLVRNNCNNPGMIFPSNFCLS